MSEFLQLLQQARDGNAAAWQALVQRYRPLLHRAADEALPQSVRRRIDPSDVAQETLLDVRRDLGEFRGSDEVEWLKWLQRVARCNVQDALRRHQQAARRSLAAQVDLERVRKTIDPPLPRATDSDTPSLALRLSEMQGAVQRACENLPDDQRTALTLRYLERCPVREIALRMDKSEAAVAGLLTRGLRHLKSLLQGDPAL